MMSLNAKPFTHGKVTVVAGPEGSDTTEYVERFLDSVIDSGYLKKGENKVLIVRHPDDDPNPEYIGRHVVEVTADLDRIASQVTRKTRTVIIVGAARNNDPRIVDLTDALVRSNRDVVVTGPNLDVDGNPYGCMDRLMSLADEVCLYKAICALPQCVDMNANRSALLGGRKFPVCTKHFYDFGSESTSPSGRLELGVGPMFSKKSRHSKTIMRNLNQKNIPYVTFRWTKDARYGQPVVDSFAPCKGALHDQETFASVAVDNVNDIMAYLGGHPQVKTIIWTEMQFYKRAFETARELVSKGYIIHGDGLHRGFDRRPFSDVPKLMCLADAVDMHYAICVDSGQPATESFRIDQTDLAQVKVGGAEAYRAKGLEFWSVQGERSLAFYFKKFKW